MSSALIAEQIASCQIQIDTCKREIQQLEKEIAELEKSLRVGDAAKDGLITSINARKAKMGTTDTLQKYALTGNHYIIGMNDDLTNASTNNLIEEFENQRSALWTKILNVETELDNKKSELSILKGNLSSLETQYQNAVNQEAWDREQERLRNEAEWNRRMEANNNTRNTR